MSATGTNVTIDGRPALRFERRLRVGIERAWRAVSEPAELERWFVVAVPWGPEAGETFSFAGMSGEITEVDPPRVLAWTFAGDAYRFELSPDGEGCVLVFTHVLDDPATADDRAAGWRTYLSRLDVHLAGEFISEEVAHATGAVTLEDGPSLRLERRYSHSPERVWRALSDPDEQAGWFPAGEPLAVTESDPPRLLAGTWFGEALRFELRADGDGCVLVFTHAFDDRDTAARTAAGWDRCFARLGALLDGEPLSEAASLLAWPEVHERYAEAFGVDPELGRRAFAEHPLT